MPCEITKSGGSVFGLKCHDKKIVLECKKGKCDDKLKCHVKKGKHGWEEASWDGKSWKSRSGSWKSRSGSHKHKKHGCCEKKKSFKCCKKSSSKKCHSGKKKCKTTCDINVKKTLLELCTISETGTCQGVTVFNYEIVIVNKSCKRLDNLSLIDSFFCLKLNTDPALSEIDPNLTEVSSDNSSVIVNDFARIVATGGELVDCKSNVAPCSVVRLCLRVGVKHCRIGADGTVFPCDFTPAQFGLSCNTVTLKGTLSHVDRCGCVTRSECFFPLVVKADSCLACPLPCPETSDVHPN
jgi:hypothetical protein